MSPEESASDFNISYVVFFHTTPLKIYSNSFFKVCHTKKSYKMFNSLSGFSTGFLQLKTLICMQCSTNSASQQQAPTPSRRENPPVSLNHDKVRYRITREMGPVRYCV